MEQLWPNIPDGSRVYGIIKLDIYQGPDGKPIMALKFGDGGTTIYATANVVELAGGAARGARLRYEDHRG